MDPFLPTIIPFWTHEPLPALFLAVLTTSCPLIVPFWMSEPFHALFLDVLIILLLELSPFGYMVGCADPFLTWHCPHPESYLFWLLWSILDTPTSSVSEMFFFWMLCPNLGYTNFLCNLCYIYILKLTLLLLYVLFLDLIHQY